MELTNDFRVGVPVERAYAVLTDVELIAPCLPGAQLQEVEGEEYRGVVKVKVGPITVQYKGAATFVEREEPTKVVLKAEGRETRGQGGASAIITAVLAPDGDGTAVTVTTDLTITGKVATFGRGVLADVSANLLGQFVTCLEGRVLADPEPAVAVHPDEQPEPEVVVVTEEVAEAVEAAAPAVRRIDSPEAAPVDLVATAGSPVLKRAAPAAAALALLWLLGVFVRRRRK